MADPRSTGGDACACALGGGCPGYQWRFIGGGGGWGGLNDHAAIRRRIESRRRELLKSLRDEIDADRRFVAVVKAPPGSGKTTLLLELAAHAARRGQRVAVAAQT